jgi:hypothetical protein
MGVTMNHEHHQSNVSDFPGKDEHPDLTAALQRESQRTPVPKALDRRVADLAMPAATPRHGWRVTGLRVAAAAVVALGLGILALLALPQAETRQRLSIPMSPASAMRDVNGDGEIDVLDALTLARQIERRDPGAVDSNGDGAADTGDVDHLMTMIVRLPPQRNDS